MLRRHWLVSVLLAAGLVLRVLAVAAYRPALIYVDTLKYLYGASPGSEPFGYTLALKIVLVAGDLGTVAVLQHLLGLAMAVTVYVVLLRRGIPRWLAALTTAPVLLDAYQLQMEQTIMPDVLFEALVVAGVAVLLWRPVVTVRFAAVAGLILAAAATVMQLGVILVVPAVIYVLAAGGGWRRATAGTGALVIAFAAVVLGYCGVSYLHDGHFWLARHQSLTGRLAASADCATLQLSAAARTVCPTPGAAGTGAGLAGALRPVATDRQRHRGPHQARRGDRGPERGRAGPATAAGGGIHRPGRGPPVRPDQDADPRRDADRALAVPGRLPGIPAVGHRLLPGALSPV